MESGRSPSYAEALKARPAPIDTGISRGVPASGGSSAATTASAVASTGTSSLGSAGTAATSWSPALPSATQSATIPKKLSWERSLTPGKFTRIPSVAGPLPPQPSPLAGLGLQVGTYGTNTNSYKGITIRSPNFQAPNSSAGCSPTSYRFQQQNLIEAQTSPRSLQATDPTANTFPLPQYPFGSARDLADQHRILPDALRSPTSGNLYNVPIGSERKESHSYVRDPSQNEGSSNKTATNLLTADEARRDSAAGPQDDSPTKSDFSALTMQDMGKGEVVHQESHHKGFNKHMRYKQMPGYLDSAFDSAYITLKTVNGDLYELPPKLRVICIKTEFVSNVQWSIQRSTWAAMDKVGERIQRCWDEREGDDERIIFLFSVNGQKSYCGLAEMIGPFKIGGDLEQWQGGNDGGGQIEWGTIPISWKYVKNVAYGWFSDIRHSHNDSVITNMWNGMHFPLDAGRIVVKRFIQRPHFTNILCWEKSRPYNPFKDVVPWQIDPALQDPRRRDDRHQPLMIEDGKASDQSSSTGSPMSLDGSRAPSRSTNLRINTAVSQHQQSAGRSARGEHFASSPFRPPTPHINVTPANTSSPFSPLPRPDQQFFVATYDDNGNLVPLTPGGHSYQTFGFQGGPGSTPHSRRSGHGVSPQPSFTTLRRGRGGYGHVGTSLGRGGMHSPAHVRSFTAFQHEAAQHSPSGSNELTTVRAPFAGGIPDVFAEPQHLRSYKSLSTLAPSAAGSSGAYGNPLHLAVEAANFVPQRHSAHTSMATSCNTAIRVPQHEMPAPGTSTPSRSGSGRGFPPSNAGPAFAPDSRMHSPPSDHLEAMKKIDGAVTPWDSHSNAPAPAVDTEQALTLEQKRIRYIRAMKRKAEMEAEEARLLMEADPAFTHDTNSGRQNPSDSEEGGLGRWVSSSSVEKRKISPMGSLSGSDWNNSETARLKADIEKLLESAPASEASGKNDGGVDV